MAYKYTPGVATGIRGDTQNKGRDNQIDELLLVYPIVKPAAEDRTILEYPFRLTDGRQSTLRILLPSLFPEQAPQLKLSQPIYGYSFVDNNLNVNIPIIRDWSPKLRLVDVIFQFDTMLASSQSRSPDGGQPTSPSHFPMSQRPMNPQIQSRMHGGYPVSMNSPMQIGMQGSLGPPRENPQMQQGPRLMPYGNPQMQSGPRPMPYGNPQMQQGPRLMPYGNPQMQQGPRPMPYGNPQMQLGQRPRPLENPQMQTGMQGAFMMGNSQRPPFPQQNVRPGPYYQQQQQVSSPHSSQSSESPFEPMEPHAEIITQCLSQYTDDQLMQLLVGKDDFESLVTFVAMDQLKMSDQSQSLKEENIRIAMENLEKEADINDRKNHVAIVKSSDYDAMCSIYASKREDYARIHESINIPSFLNQLQSEAHQLDEQSETQLRTAIDGDVAVPEFIENYMNLRKQHHRKDLLLKAAVHLT